MLFLIGLRPLWGSRARSRPGCCRHGVQRCIPTARLPLAPALHVGNLVTLHPPSSVPWGVYYWLPCHLPQGNKSGQSRTATVLSVESIKEGFWEPQGFSGSQGEPETRRPRGSMDRGSRLPLWGLLLALWGSCTFSLHMDAGTFPR